MNTEGQCWRISEYLWVTSSALPSSCFTKRCLLSYREHPWDQWKHREPDWRKTKSPLTLKTVRIQAISWGVGGSLRNLITREKHTLTCGIRQWQSTVSLTDEVRRQFCLEAGRCFFLSGLDSAAGKISWTDTVAHLCCQVYVCASQPQLHIRITQGLLKKHLCLGLTPKTDSADVGEKWECAYKNPSRGIKLGTCGQELVWFTAQI